VELEDVERDVPQHGLDLALPGVDEQAHGLGGAATVAAISRARAGSR
jgi:hypothetical protein